MKINIDISWECDEWRDCGVDIGALLDDAIGGAVGASLAGGMLEGKNCEVSVVLADDAFVRTLNAGYRDKDKATNVLSFPQIDFTRLSGHDDAAPLPLGDIILAYQTIAAESAAQEKSFRDHFAHLVVHGTLHLLGYDHEQEDEAQAMETLEIAVLKSIGIENPYSSENYVR